VFVNVLTVFLPNDVPQAVNPVLRTAAWPAYMPAMAMAGHRYIHDKVVNLGFTGPFEKGRA